MGHLLATVNPEAAAAIGTENVDTSKLPAIGSIVRYYPRPGEGRGGRREFSMIVTEHAKDGRVGGVAIFDASDFRDIMPIWQYSDTNVWPAWDWVEAKAGSVTYEDLQLTQQAIASTGHKVAAALQEISKYGNPNARIDFMSQQIMELQNRLSLVEQTKAASGASQSEVDHLRARVLALEGELGIGEAARAVAAPSRGKRKGK